MEEEHDPERLRPRYDFNNAVLLYEYGYWSHARGRFERIYRERCKGALASPEGLYAYNALHNMAVQMGDAERVDALAVDLTRRECTFGADEDVDCTDPENAEHPLCRADRIIRGRQFRLGLQRFRSAEAMEAGPTQIREYEWSAGMLVTAVDANPAHPDAPIALILAATALQRAGRPSSAQELYQRVIRDVAGLSSDDDEEQERLDKIVAEANFELGRAAGQAFQYDDALASYQRLADSDRFSRSTNEDVIRWRRDSVINAALLLRNLGRYEEAEAYYRRLAADPQSSDALRRDARFAIAEMAYEREDWRTANTAYGDFIQAYARDSEAGEQVVLSYWRLAQILDAQGRENDRALRDVVQAFSDVGAEPGSIAALYASEARFHLIDKGMERMEAYRLDFGRPRDGAAFQARLGSEIDRGAQMAVALRDGFATVPPYRRPVWAIASLVRTGRVFELLTRGILEAEVVAPADVQRIWRQLDAYDRESVALEFEGTIRDVLAERVKPFECKAIAAYALAARAGRLGNIDNEYTREAAERLQAYGEERIAECIALEAQSSSLEAYRAGEFARAPAGREEEVPRNVSPPALVVED